jgi:alkylresorcinol/alkylpyrone synthase
MARIVSTATALPPHRLDRATYERYVTLVYPERAAVARRIIENARIETRWLSAPPERLIEPRSIAEQSRDYKNVATALGETVTRRALDAAHLAPDAIDLFITTSCTGLMIPSLDAFLVEKLGFRRDVRRLPITELGCAAGASALARARDHVLAYPEHHVLIVACELCSLTYQRGDPSMTNLVAASLFGDGAAAAVVAGARATRPARPSPAIVDSVTHLFPKSHHLMGFELEDGGLRIVLDRSVAPALKGRVRPLVEPLLARHGVALGDLRFAVIHPGGRRILEDLERDLGIAALTTPSWSVLRRVGNLSSATVLFVLDDVLARPPPPAGAPGLLAAFGPGFSADLSLLRWEA